MERKKYFCYLLIWLSTGHLFSVSAGQYASGIYQAYIEGDMDAWKEILTEMEKVENKDTAFTLELLHYYYGYTGYLIGTNQSKEAGSTIKKGEILINQLLNEEPEHPLALSYKGTFLAFKIALSKLKAVTLGPQSMRYINKAYKLAPEHYQIMSDKANLLYYSPSIIGGNKENAIELYKQAIRQMETSGSNTENWFYLSIQTTLAGIYEERGEKEAAHAIYTHLLGKEPHFKWVRDELLPALDK